MLMCDGDGTCTLSPVCERVFLVHRPMEKCISLGKIIVALVGTVAASCEYDKVTVKPLMQIAPEYAIKLLITLRLSGPLQLHLHSRREISKFWNSARLYYRFDGIYNATGQPMDTVERSLGIVILFWCVCVCVVCVCWRSGGGGWGLTNAAIRYIFVLFFSLSRHSKRRLFYS